MKIIVLVFALLLIQSCKSDDPFYKEIAYRYAPIHYQDTDDSNAKADYITRFDYDNNWTGTDNWEHLGTGDFAAHVYYSVTETATHWFIVYAFFHPRDWTDHAVDQEHENDMEGVLTIVRKNNSRFGNIEGMITVAHNDFYSFTPSGSILTNGSEDIDGTLSFENFDGALHPKTCQEAKGHGMKAWPYIGDFSGKRDEDGIIYYPSKSTAEVPSSGNDRSVSYILIDLNAIGNFWTFQLLESNSPSGQRKTFASWGTLKGDDGGSCGDGLTVTCSENSAHTPWGWDDGDDGPNYSGELALDPAAVTDYYFNGGNFDNKYSRNKYLQELKTGGYSDTNLPNGWPSQLKLSELYQKLTP